MKMLTITKDDGYYTLRDETGFTGFLSFYEGEGGISGLALESESYCVTLIKTKAKNLDELMEEPESCAKLMHAILEYFKYGNEGLA